MNVNTKQPRSRQQHTTQQQYTAQQSDSFSEPRSSPSLGKSMDVDITPPPPLTSQAQGSSPLTKKSPERVTEALADAFWKDTANEAQSRKPGFSEAFEIPEAPVFRPTVGPGLRESLLTIACRRKSLPTPSTILRASEPKVGSHSFDALCFDIVQPSSMVSAKSFHRPR